MDSELIKMLIMSYDELCAYLQNKYGLPPKDYFFTEECRSKTPIARTSEGLFIHHNAEKLGGVSNLGNRNLANLFPFEFQKRENLTYCNYIEHLLFHLKINARCCSTFEWPFEISYFFNSLGFFWICTDINLLYKDNGSDKKFRNDWFLAIKPYYDDYISILKGVLCFIDDNYVGDKDIQIFEGMKLYFDVFSDECRILRNRKDSNGKRLPYDDGKNIKQHYKRITVTVKSIDKDNDKIVLFTNNKSNESKLSLVESGYNFSKVKADYINSMCKLSDGTLWEELKAKLMQPYTEQDKMVSRCIKEGVSREK